MNIGLTGGIGCGKSTVLQLLRARDWRVFESDAYVRQLLGQDPEVVEAIRARFGEAVFDADGRVDRGRLASIVFSDSTKLSALEALLHPRVRSAWLKELQTSPAGLVVEIPLLFEKDLQSHFDVTCCVACHPETQSLRLRARGWTPPQIEERLRNQWPLADKMTAADVILLNDGSREHLEAQIDEWMRLLGWPPAA